jgi:hypothetical protein
MELELARDRSCLKRDRDGLNSLHTHFPGFVMRRKTRHSSHLEQRGWTSPQSRCPWMHCGPALVDRGPRTWTIDFRTLAISASRRRRFSSSVSTALIPTEPCSSAECVCSDFAGSPLSSWTGSKGKGRCGLSTAGIEESNIHK